MLIFIVPQVENQSCCVRTMVLLGDTTGSLSPPHTGNTKLGRVITATLPPVGPPACLPMVDNTCRLYVFKPFEPRPDSQLQVVLEGAVSTPSGILKSDNC